MIIFQIFLDVSNSVCELESSHSENIELKNKTTKEQNKNNDVSEIIYLYFMNIEIIMLVYFS